MIEWIKLFEKSEKSASWDLLKCGQVIHQTLKNVQNALEQKWKYNKELQEMSQTILTRAIMLDSIFNHIHEVWFLNEENIREVEAESSDLYHLTPAIWVFYRGQPVFLNRNYVEALWGERVEEIKSEINDGTVMENRYTPESGLIAKEAVERLNKWEQYKDLILATQWGRILSWNSFGKKGMLEIRLGNDITHGRFQSETENKNTPFEKRTSLKTQKIVGEFIGKVSHIIPLSANDQTKLYVFFLLSEILDKVWDDGQYIMNMTDETKSQDDATKMICNNNYLEALELTYDQVIEKIKNGKLYNDHYSPETLVLIKGLWNTLEKEWWYIEEFPLIDAKKQHKTYTWYRKLITNKEMGIQRTFWIGNSAIPAYIIELLKWVDNNE